MLAFDIGQDGNRVLPPLWSFVVVIGGLLIPPLAVAAYGDFALGSPFAPDEPELPQNKSDTEREHRDGAAAVIATIAIAAPIGL